MRYMADEYEQEQGPNKIAPSPVPVMWEQLPVTEGIFNEEITKMNAPDIASSVMERLSACRRFLMEKKPISRNGRQRTPHATQYPAGR